MTACCPPTTMTTCCEGEAKAECCGTRQTTTGGTAENEAPSTCGCR
ncbi:hypothetical protein ACIBF7_15105 [Nonomuraea sp. NPDC050478]